ncbi:hypothetical protein [Paenibacillus beijingensis]|uniref:Uncharacterized protein n=1 Tax=Paenibacillus beijingensis TaxID=1126833 RepID=A0A0D5NE09_9BACL|nr:hypothetical protein [Paenibacillus beijingensis]AJY73395.1 hypothetical protein VN24_00570 [Paenibacillus beijingensis]
MAIFLENAVYAERNFKWRISRRWMPSSRYFGYWRLLMTTDGEFKQGALRSPFKANCWNANRNSTNTVTMIRITIVQN